MASSKTPQHPAEPGPPTTVLVADDEPDICGLVRMMLKKKGVKTVVAGDGDEALALLRTEQTAIGALFLDLTIPTTNPDTLLSDINEVCRRTSTPIVIMSGYSENDAREAAKGNSFAGFLQKPFQPSTLYAQLADLQILDERPEGISPDPLRPSQIVFDRHGSSGSKKPGSRRALPF